MKKVTRLMIVFATSLVFIGGAIFTVAMTLNGWDFSKLTTKDYVTKSYEITQEFTSIDVEVSTADVNVKLATDGKCMVVTYEDEKIEYTPNVSNGTLKISKKDNRKWYDYIGINAGSSQITVYLTQSQLNTLNIKASTADVTINNVYCGEISIPDRAVERLVIGTNKVGMGTVGFSYVRLIKNYPVVDRFILGDVADYEGQAPANWTVSGDFKLDRIMD